MRVQISTVKVKPGRRAAVPEHIEELSKSISEVGLLNPITVDRDNTLIAGLHRLEAAKLLGWTEIECTVSSLEGLQAELAELDENFIRSELSTVEYGELLLRRKEIYEALHPETKKGPAQAAGMNRAVGNHVGGTVPMTSKSFTADTSEKLGVSRTTIERQIRIAEKLAPGARELIRHSDISKKTALKLTHLEPGQQIEAAKLLIAGEVKSVEEYLARTDSPASETQTLIEQPPVDVGDRLTQDVPSPAVGDGTAAQTTAADMKEEPKGAEPENVESRAAGQRGAEPSSHGQTDRNSRRKTSDAKRKRTRSVGRRIEAEDNGTIKKRETGIGNSTNKKAAE